MSRQPTKPKQGFDKKETKKTINKKEKGDRAERGVKKIFENSGWQVYKPVRTKFNPKDIFGVGDLLAIKLYQKPHLIQVKTNKKDINFDQAIKQMAYFSSCGFRLIYVFKQKGNYFVYTPTAIIDLKKYAKGGSKEIIKHNRREIQSP